MAAEGVPGVLAVCVIGVLAGTGFSAMGITLALRARNASTVQGIFPLVFVVLFISSAFFPRALLERSGRHAGRLQPALLRRRRPAQPDHLERASAEPILEGLAAALGIVLVFGGLGGRGAADGRLADA